jgi:AP-3 complex subunit delta
VMSSASAVASSILFQKTLSDVVKGIRIYKNDPTEFISQCIAECKNELATTDPYMKSEAIRKLTYLQMVGYNIAWASFSIVEVMSQSRFDHKRIGYLAANQVLISRPPFILPPPP